MSKNRIVHAPVTSPDIVLDIGCGTGVVTRYLCRYFPNAKHVYGIDLCPVPPKPEDAKISNLNFIQGDIFKLAGSRANLAFGSADFVYSRLLLCGITDWPGYLQTVLNMLKPGGWAEIDDWVEDVYYTDNRGVPREEWEWLRCIRSGAARQGLDMDAGLNIPRHMKSVGFINVQTWKFPVPLWIDEARPETRPMAEHLIGDKWGLYCHLIPSITNHSNYPEAGIRRLVTEARRDVGEERGKEQLFCVTIGQKPVR